MLNGNKCVKPRIIPSVKKVALYKSPSKQNQLLHAQRVAANRRKAPFCHVNPCTNTHATKGKRRVAGIRSGVGMNQAAVHSMVNDDTPAVVQE